MLGPGWRRVTSVRRPRQEQHCFRETALFSAFPQEAGGMAKPTSRAHHRTPQLIILILAPKTQLNRPTLHEITLKKCVCVPLPISICEMNPLRCCLAGGRCPGGSGLYSIFVPKPGLCNPPLEFTIPCFPNSSATPGVRLLFDHKNAPKFISHFSISISLNFKNF